MEELAKLNLWEFAGKDLSKVDVSKSFHAANIGLLDGVEVELPDELQRYALCQKISQTLERLVNVKNTSVHIEYKIRIIKLTSS